MASYETDVLEGEELDALLGQINRRSPSGARNYALLQLMASAGLRCAEALAVEPRMIRRERWEGRELWVLRLPKKVTKGKRARDPIPLPLEAKVAVDEWAEARGGLGISEGAFFCTISRGRRKGLVGPGQVDDVELQPGRPVGSRYVRELVARLAEKAGIARRVHPHMLRHTALTRLYDQTQDLRLVQDVAGHSDPRTTSRYAHVKPSKVAEAMGAFEGEEPEEKPASGTSELVSALLADPEALAQIRAALREVGD